MEQNWINDGKRGSVTVVFDAMADSSDSTIIEVSGAGQSRLAERIADALNAVEANKPKVKMRRIAPGIYNIYSGRSFNSWGEIDARNLKISDMLGIAEAIGLTYDEVGRVIAIMLAKGNQPELAHSLGIEYWGGQ